MTPDSAQSNGPLAPAGMRPETRRLGVVVAALFLLQGLLLFGYRYFEQQADDPSSSGVEQFINEMTGAIGALLLFPIAYWLCTRFRLHPGVRWKAAVVHSAALPLISASHTLLNWVFRMTLYPVFGVSAGYGPLKVRLAQEFFNDILWYAIIIVLAYGFLYYRDVRTRELETMRLQTELGRAKLRNLQARLHPHFLFNTLNAISAHVGDDPGGAERMIEQLGALLRRSLSASGAQETTVAEEIETLELYLSIMKERLGDRLETLVEVENGVEDRAIPTLLLQPLVENAIEHGLGPRARGGRVSVRIRREDDGMSVVVEDDGVGLKTGASEALGSGFGLSATAERVRQLYGDRGHLEITSSEAGTRVTVVIPWTRGVVETAASGSAKPLPASETARAGIT